jgi:hypothetical protein
MASGMFYPISVSYVNPVDFGFSLRRGMGIDLLTDWFFAFQDSSL